MGSLKVLPLGYLPTRHRAEEFACALDAAGVAARPTATIGLARRLSAAGEALVPVAAPRAEFRSALRTRLMAVAAVQSASPSIPVARAQEPDVDSARWGSSRRAQRTLGLAAGAMASCVAVTGVAVASSQSLPGDPFYSVKRTTEALQLATTGGDEAKGQRHLDFAATRLRELRDLTSGRGSSERVGVNLQVVERVQTTLADMDTETRKGTALLTDAFRSSQTPAPLRTLSKFVTTQSVQLERLLPALPPESQNFAVASLALVADVADDTEQLMEFEACQANCDAPVKPTASPTQTPTAGPTSSGSPSPQATVTPSPGTTPSPSGTPEPSLAGTPDDEVSPRPTGTVSPGPSASASPSPSPSLSSSTESARPQEVDLLPRPTRPSSWLLPLPL